jgi:MinD-like ATPase involved in chromosome partitioning or flagellar assembly
MSLIAFTSAKGSPGVTTAALGVASVWESQTFVIEADPAGGDLAHRFGISGDVGLMSLAAAARRDKDCLGEHSQIAGGVNIVVGPPSPEQAAAAVGMIASSKVLDVNDAVLIADCGRIDLRGPSRPILNDADLVVVFVRPEIADVAHVAAVISDLKRTAIKVCIVVVGNGPYAPGDVASVLDIELFGTIPHDPVGARIASGKPGSAKSFQKSAFIRACRELRATLENTVEVQGEMKAAS